LINPFLPHFVFSTLVPSVRIFSNNFVLSLPFNNHMSKQALVQRTLSALKQGGTLSIRSKVPQTNIRIVPEWREDGKLSINSTQPSSFYNLSITQSVDKMTSLGRSEAHIVVEIDPIDGGACISVVAQVPEKLNVSCHLEHGGTVAIEKKLEGDVELSTSQGDILLNKVRGHRISLQATGTIYASDVLEAQHLTISTSYGRVRAKRIHGSQVVVQVHDHHYQKDDVALMDEDDDGAVIDISSLYVSGSGSANLVAESSGAVQSDATTKSIRCKSHHGHVNVQGDHMVELGGANGSFDVDCKGEASIHIDSLASDSISIASTQKKLSLTMDRKLIADLRLVSGANVRDLARSVLLEDEEHSLEEGLHQYQSRPAREPISVVTGAFTEVPLKSGATFTHLNYVQGFVDNKSLEPDSRFEQKGGKIRLDGAANQALNGFTFSDKAIRPLIVGASEGRIAVESLSWLGAIARRYGLEESEREGDLGRQATRRGRTLNEPDRRKD
jgi:hypothetical protein